MKLTQFLPKLSKSVAPFAIYALGVLLLAVTYKTRAYRRLLPEYLEYFAILACVLAMAVIPQVRACAKSFPAIYKWFLSGFFALLLLGQFIDKLRLTFPFTSWAMYSSITDRDDFPFHRYIALVGNGSEITLDPEKLLPSNDGAVVTSKLDTLIDTAFPRDGSEGSKRAQRALEKFVSVLAQLEEEKGDVSIRSIRIIRHLLPMRNNPEGKTEDSMVFEAELAK